MAKFAITKFFQDTLGLPDAPTRPYGGAKRGPGWAYPVKTDNKKSIKRRMRWNKDLKTSVEAKPASKALNPKRYAESTGQTYKRPNFRDWLAKHRKS